MNIDGEEEKKEEKMEVEETAEEEPIDMAERTLKWQHLAPTAPDTLSKYFYNIINDYELI